MIDYKGWLCYYYYYDYVTNNDDGCYYLHSDLKTDMYMENIKNIP